jgi:STE24 endopeptidase
MLMRIQLNRADFALQENNALNGSLIAFPFTPLSSWLSRHHEWQADQFTCELSNSPDALATALIKLSGDNLANLHPHPLYAKFYYSHPPVLERVYRLFEEAKKDIIKI